MSRRYSPEYRILVLRILSVYRGDVTAASRFTGVPERTLRDWRLQEWRARRQQSRAQPPPPGLGRRQQQS